MKPYFIAILFCATTLSGTQSPNQAICYQCKQDMQQKKEQASLSQCIHYDITHNHRPLTLNTVMLMGLYYAMNHAVQQRNTGLAFSWTFLYFSLHQAVITPWYIENDRHHDAAHLRICPQGRFIMAALFSLACIALLHLYTNY